MAYDSQTLTILVNKLRYDVDRLRQKVAVLHDEKPIGTAGGTAVHDAWTTRTLNQVSYDPDDLIIALENNEFTLGKGVWGIRAASMFHATQGTRTRIINVTDNTVVAYSLSNNIDNQTNIAVGVSVTVEVTRDTKYRIEYYCDTGGTDSLGKASGIANFSALLMEGGGGVLLESGAVLALESGAIGYELYSRCEITRMDHLKPF